MPTLTSQLDRLETTLPPIPASFVHLQRTVAGATYDQFTAAVETVVTATRNFLDSAWISGRTVTGQARAAGSDVLTTTKRNGKQVAGQSTAQGRRVAASAKREVTNVVDAAIDAIDPTPGSGKPYEEWTKAELLERARQLGILRATTLNKQQLMAALRKA